jgi:protein-S-isoprenylcysteine O-methyltransferase Ste14
MMCYYKNFSLGAWVYLTLHGSYGFFWMLKYFTFPDTSFQRNVTIVCFIYPWFVALLPYTYSGYYMMSGQANQNPSPERIFVCVWVYVTGIVFMLGADGQKYFMLRERRGLIHDGFSYWTRNPNYFGEILLYSSFGMLVQNSYVWFVLGYMWCIVFMIKITIKDNSLSKKVGYEE